MYRNIVIFLIITLLACGCESPREKEKLAFIQSMDKWIGHTADELITTQGAPSNIYHLQSGGRELEYLRVLSLSEEEKRALHHPEMLKYYSQNRYVSNRILEAQKAARGQHPEQNIYVPDTRPPVKDSTAGVGKYVLGAGKICKLLFEVTAGNIIESWSIDEGTCY